MIYFFLGKKNIFEIKSLTCWIKKWHSMFKNLSLCCTAPVGFIVTLSLSWISSMSDCFFLPHFWQWRIQDFPDGAVTTTKVGAPPIIRLIFSWKLHEIERNWTQIRVRVPPPPPANVNSCPARMKKLHLEQSNLKFKAQFAFLDWVVTS